MFTTSKCRQIHTKIGKGDVKKGFFYQNFHWLQRVEKIWQEIHKC